MNRIMIAPLTVIAVIAVLMLSAAVGLGQGSTASKCAQSKISLGKAGTFRVLGNTSVTNTGSTVVRGNLGVSPGTSITGFPPGTVKGTIHNNDPAATRAQKDLAKAITNGMGRTACATTVSGNLGGTTLGPGLYISTSSLAISSGNLTLNAHGHPAAVFIFVMKTSLTTTTGLGVTLKGGANATRIYWVVGSSASLGAGSVMYGSILSHVSISLATGAMLHGRALASTGAVTLAGNKVFHHISSSHGGVSA